MNKKRIISIWELKNDPENSKFKYKLIRERSSYAIGGQGDVDFVWEFVCINHAGELVLITESYDISWENNPSPDNIETGNLSVTEEKIIEELSPDTACKEVYLPIELHLQGKSFS